jgi:hypothetical protein
MRRSGLDDIQVRDRLLEAQRRLQIKSLQKDLSDGLITRNEYEAQVKVLREQSRQQLEALKANLRPREVIEDVGELTSRRRRRRTIEQEQILDNVPQMRGASILAGGAGEILNVPSRFAGTGQYERTSEVVVNIPRQTQNTVLSFGQPSDSALVQPSALAFGQPQRLNQPQAFAQNIALGLAQSLGLRFNQRQDQPQIPRTGQPQSPRNPQTPRTPPKTPSILQPPRTSTTQAPPRRTTKRPPQRPTRPPVRPPRLFQPPLQQRRNLLESALDKLGFDIFVRKKGRDVRIGQASSKKQAANVLRDVLGGTISASGFIQSGGKKIDVSGLFGTGFRKGKKDPLRIVEKRSKRLDNPLEVSTLQRARRQRPSTQNVLNVGRSKKRSSRKRRRSSRNQIDWLA